MSEDLSNLKELLRSQSLAIDSVVVMSVLLLIELESTHSFNDCVSVIGSNVVELFQGWMNMRLTNPRKESVYAMESLVHENGKKELEATSRTQRKKKTKRPNAFRVPIPFAILFRMMKSWERERVSE